MLKNVIIFLLLKCIIFLLVLIRRYRKHCLLDPLTKTLNRSFVDNYLPRIFNKMDKRKKLIAICMIDLNDFKSLNDKHGHIYGDFVLQQFTSHIKKHIRKSDYLIRYGGDEFLLVCPETSRNEILKLMDRLKKTTSNITQFSFGLSFYPNNGDNYLELINVADKNLYADKNSKCMSKSTL